MTPNTYSVINKKIRGIPILNIDTPKNGVANKAAGTKPIRVLKIAVNVSAVIISLSLIGAAEKIREISTPNFFKKHHIIANTRSKKKSYNMPRLNNSNCVFVKR